MQKYEKENEKEKGKKEKKRKRGGKKGEKEKEEGRFVVFTDILTTSGLLLQTDGRPAAGRAGQTKNRAAIFLGR